MNRKTRLKVCFAITLIGFIILLSAFILPLDFMVLMMLGLVGFSFTFMGILSIFTVLVKWYGWTWGLTR